jgi:membrane protein
VVLLTWLYLTGLIMILGGEVNAILEHASVEGKAKGARVVGEVPPPPELRPSAVPPGSAKSQVSARRTKLRFLLRKLRST